MVSIFKLQRVSLISVELSASENKHLHDFETPELSQGQDKEITEKQYIKWNCHSQEIEQVSVIYQEREGDRSTKLILSTV